MKTLRFLLSENSLEQAAMALGLALLLFLMLLFTRNVLVSRLRRLSARTAVLWDDVLAEVIASTKLPFLLSLSVLAGTTQIELPASVANLPYKAMMVLLILQLGIWATRGVAAWINLRSRQNELAGDGGALTNYGVVAFIVRLLIWVLALLLLLDNLGVNITALVASLGIGGVAVALALQNVLGDLFASLSIALDNPFVVGDFIVVDDLMGTVRHVGLKTTRIQSLGGEELVFSNADLLKSRIRNYKRMADRRVVFSIGLTMDTDPARLEALPPALRAMVEEEAQTRFDRAHFQAISESSLRFEVVYYVLSADYLLYMDIQQRINLKILNYCRAQGLRLAYPTRTLELHQAGAAQAR